VILYLLSGACSFVYIFGHSRHVSSVAFSPDGQRLASGSADQTVKVWNTRTGQELLSLKGHSGWVSNMAFGPDGQKLIFWDEMYSDGQAIVWDLQNRRPIPDAQEQLAPERRFSPDGQIFAHVEGSVIRLIRNPTAAEIEERRWFTRPDPGWQSDGTQAGTVRSRIFTPGVANTPVPDG